MLALAAIICGGLVVSTIALTLMSVALTIAIAIVAADIVITVVALCCLGMPGGFGRYLGLVRGASAGVGKNIVETTRKTVP